MPYIPRPSLCCTFLISARITNCFASYQVPPPAGFRWQAGAICTNSSPLSSQALRGKHLLVSSNSWAPYSIKQHANDIIAWWGHDIDLMNELAQYLGFTYSVVDLNSSYATHGPDVTDGTYTPFLFHAVNLSDLVLQPWDPTTYRRDVISFPQPFYDNSRVLVLKSPSTKESDFWEIASQLLKPFTPTLWIAVACLFLVNAVVLFMLEWDQEDFQDEKTIIGGVSHSLYLSTMLLTGAGAHNPHSMIGRFFSASWGLTLLLIVSWYTADLASSRTVSKVADLSWSSIEDMKSQGRTACVHRGDTLQASGLYQRMHPDLYIRVIGDNDDDATLTAEQLFARMLGLLEVGECDGLIVETLDPRVHAWFQSPETTCKVQVAGAPVKSWFAGWATNKRSACVEQAIGYGLQVMDERQVLQQLRMKYLGIPKRCPTKSLVEQSSAVDVADLAGIFLLYLVCGLASVAAVVIKKFPHLFHPTLHPRGTKQNARDRNERETTENSVVQPCGTKQSEGKAETRTDGYQGEI
eukprot:TRINITY_DN31517_c0_g1_i1.p1 TRINITY_DN31517_c0_g1~~TRINITY_DN31517_c0_g1_i1.p1  ORF type:complete len:523 (-),score=57.11 TRINITY_DN31517_c0_g1_i1:353-1921(-)